MRLPLLLALLVLSLWMPAFAGMTNAEPYPFTSSSDAARFSELTKQVRCIVCQHQSVAESSTPIADGIRRKIYQMIVAKKSNSEIKDYLVKRYGEFILLEPRVNGKTVLLWAFPFVALGLGAALVMRLFAKQRGVL